jgi:succinate dehydrogenase / fumarate reductase cytochrome b subunit
MFGYRISWSQLAWYGHRLSGIGVLVYLFMQIVLMAALVYHSLNGLRVIAMDFWPATTRWYRPLTYAVIIVTFAAMVPLGLIMITPYAPWNGR